MRKKIALGLLLSGILTLGLIHTQWVERRILNSVLDILRDQGFEAEVERMDLNLFRMSASIKGLSLRGQGLSADIGSVLVDAGWGVIAGRVDLDAVEILNGEAVYLPPEAPEDASADHGPISLPEVRLGRLTVGGLKVSVGEESADLNLSLSDVALGYRDQLLTGTVTGEHWKLADREIPEATLSLSLRTESFQTFNEINVSLATGDSHFGIEGQIKEGLSPDLTIFGNAGKDLVPELQGVTLEGTIKPGDIRAKFRGVLADVLDELIITAETRFDYEASPLQIPVTVVIGDLATGSVDIALDDLVSGDFSFQANADAVNTRWPSVALSSAKMTGEFEAGDAVVAKANVEAIGRGTLRGRGEYRDGTANFTLAGSLIPGSEISLWGRYDESFTADGWVLLPGIDALADFVDLPSELCTGPIFLQGRGTANQNRWTIPAAMATVQDFSYDNMLQDNFTFYVQGDQTMLHGELHGDSLNPDAAAVAFAFDPNDRTWRDLQVDLETEPLPLLDYTGRLALQAYGSGPMMAPNLDGFFAVDLFDDDRLANAESPFEFRGRKLVLRDLAAQSAHFNLDGTASADVSADLTWDVDFILTTWNSDAYQPVLGEAMPESTVFLRGNQSALDVSMSIPEQVYRFAGIELPLTADEALQMDVQPNVLDGDGGMPGFTISGLRFDALTIRLRDGLLRADMAISLTGPEALRSHLGETYWPQELRLSSMSGKVFVETQIENFTPRLSVRDFSVVGTWEGSPFSGSDVSFKYEDERLTVEPFQGTFAGIDAAVTQANVLDDRSFLPESYDEQGRPVHLRLDWALDDEELLQDYLKDLWPSPFSIDSLRGVTWLHLDTFLDDPAVVVKVERFEGAYEYAQITSDYLVVSLYNGLNFQPGKIDVENVPFELSPTENGFVVTAQPTADVLTMFVPELLGDAQFDFRMGLQNRKDGFYLDGSVGQSGGTLIHTDPYLAVQDLKTTFKVDPKFNVWVEEGEASVNGGKVYLDAQLDLSGESPLGKAEISAEQVRIDMIDYQTVVDSVIEWRANDETGIVEGAVVLSDGQFNSDLKVENVVTDFIAGIPELYFPDPELEKTKVQINILTQNPFIVNLPIGHMEMESPSLIIGGNLAEPVPMSGPLNINEGSALNFGNQGLVFRNSQIQFHPNRPNDPYLQLVLESQGVTSKNALSLTGYLSDLDADLDESNMLAIASSYLFSSKVSSLFSFEGEISNTLFDSSFNFVVSKPLTRQVVTRYAIPLADQNQKQRFEVTIGPYLNNFVSLSRQDQVASGSLLHTRRFGYPGGVKPDVIRRVRFKPEHPRSIRKLFTLYSEDIFSPSQWRRAHFELLLALREQGYLDAQLSHVYENGTLLLDLQLGPQTELIVEGLGLTDEEHQQVLRNLRKLDEPGLRVASNLIKRLALAKGYPAAAVFHRQEENRLIFEVLVGVRQGNARVDFGPGNELLANLIEGEEQRQSWINTYTIDERAAVAKVRARLAAKGYLTPVIGEGGFVSPYRFSMPVEPGVRGLLIDVLHNGESVASEYLEAPFEYGLIAKVNKEILDSMSERVSINIKPRKRGPHVVLEVTTRVIRQTEVQELLIQGESRISERKIRRFIGFRPGMTQDRLIEAQQRLIKAGPFRMARLQSSDETAILEVDERHRWDADVQVTWNERTDFGTAIQFKDRQLFNGFHDVMVRAETSQREDRLLARFSSQRIWGLPLDVGVTFEWFREKGLDPVTLSDGLFLDVIDQEPEKREIKFEVSYPFTSRQTLSAGVVWQRNLLRENATTYFFTFPDDPDQFTEANLFDSVTRELTTTLTPFRLAYIYRNLDRVTDPRNGFLGTANIDRYTKLFGQETEAFVGTRMTVKGSGFKTWGRWLWASRFEIGLLQGEPPEELRPSGFEDSPFFVLGGPASVRGFENNFLGPLTFRNEGDDIIVEFLGGESSFFFSQELNYDLNFYGVSLSPFIDGGWVWDQREDFFQTDLVYTGGIGLGMDTPIGHFRIDWATPIEDKTFEDMLFNNSIFNEEIDAGRKAAITEFSFRFGRVF